MIGIPLLQTSYYSTNTDWQSMGIMLGIVAIVITAVACLEGRPGIPSGESCDSSSECLRGLVCTFGYCRAECYFDRDCPDGSACVAVEGSAGLRVCTTPAEESCHEDGCPPGLVCSPDGICREGCVEDDDCGPGRICRESVCIEGEAGAVDRISRSSVSSRTAR